jgi:CheY-like chemotaxis protein
VARSPSHRSSVTCTQRGLTCAAANPAGASWLQLLRPVRRVAELGSFDQLASVNILYLENHAVFAEQVTLQFLASHRVTVVPSLSAARSTLASGAFDLVLSDYDLDDGKGEEFVRECRATHPRLPIIAVSSHEAGNAALVRSGASAVCSKMEFDRIQQVIGSLADERV